MEFKVAKLDTMSTLITIVVTVFLIAFAIFFPAKHNPFDWVISLLMISIVLFSYLLSPRRYYIQNGNFIIEKVVGKKIIIPLSMIEGFFEVKDFNKLKPVRSMGNGGLFGYYGIFTTRDYGNINCQLTRLKNIIIIKSKKGFFAISPERPESLIDWLKSFTGISAIKETTEIRPSKGEAKYSILLIPIAIFILSIIMVFLLYQKLPAKIATHFDFQGNADRWAPKISFLYLNIFPQVILFAINVIIFAITRNKYCAPKPVYLLVSMISLIQIFSAYTSFDIYWFNTHNTHFVPLLYAFALLAMLLLILFYFYNRNLTKQKMHFKNFLR